MSGGITFFDNIFLIHLNAVNYEVLIFQDIAFITLSYTLQGIILTIF